MRLDLTKKGGLVPTHPRVRETAIPGLLQGWIRGVSAPTIAARMHDLRLFGSFAWRFDDVSRTIAHVIETLQSGIATLDSLARAWDDEQRSNGLAWNTRARRRKTLSALVSFLVKERAAPRGVRLDAITRDAVSSGVVIERVDDAIRSAMLQRRERDAAIVCLVWENGATLAAVQRMRIGDLPIACSDRCALALEIMTRGRAATAYVFHGRDASKPIAAETICRVLQRCGLPGLVEIRRARAKHLRELRCTDDASAPRVLAGEI